VMDWRPKTIEGSLPGDLPPPVSSQRDCRRLSDVV